MDDSEHAVNKHNQYYSDWAKIFEEYIRPLLEYARRLTNGKMQDAEDLVQETFCRVLSYPKNPLEVSNPLSYLRRILRNVWSAKWKREKVALTDSLSQILDDPIRQKEHPTVEPEVLRTSENQGLLEELRLRQGPLTEEEKFLLNSLLDGQTFEEIAATVGEDVCRTKTRWRALLTKLRYRIETSKGKARGSGQ